MSQCDNCLEQLKLSKSHNGLCDMCNLAEEKGYHTYVKRPEGVRVWEKKEKRAQRIERLRTYLKVEAGVEEDAERMAEEILWNLELRRWG